MFIIVIISFYLIDFVVQTKAYNSLFQDDVMISESEFQQNFFLRFTFLCQLDSADNLILQALKISNFKKLL